MTRGTTPIHVIKVPVSTVKIKDLIITYKQGKNVILEKRINDVEFGDKSVKLKLTQQETLLFSARTVASGQIKIKTVSNDVWASKEFQFAVYDVMNVEVM